MAIPTKFKCYFRDKRFHMEWNVTRHEIAVHSEVSESSEPQIITFSEASTAHRLCQFCDKISFLNRHINGHMKAMV